MDNKNLSAFPIKIKEGEIYDGHLTTHGLTKREYFSGLAMQGLMACDQKGKGVGWNNILKHAAELSVQMADYLIAELEK